MGRDAATEEEQAAKGQQVGSQHPLAIGDGDMEGLLGRRHGDDDDGSIEDHHQL